MIQQCGSSFLVSFFFFFFFPFIKATWQFGDMLLRPSIHRRTPLPVPMTTLIICGCAMHITLNVAEISPFEPLRSTV